MSRSAVSRTFTEGASVSIETRAKVMKAAAELGYHVNHLARGLIRSETGIVCLLVGEIGTPYQSALLDVTTRRLQAAGKVVMVLNTAGEPKTTEAALRQTLNYRADATIVFSGSPPSTLVETCIASGQRVIMINRDDLPKGTEQISRRERGGGRRGREDAAPRRLRAGRRRQFHRRHAQHRRTRDELRPRPAAEGLDVVVSREGPTTHGYATGVAAARVAARLVPSPRGVFCVTDLLALGFMDVARREFERRIPDDLCIVGFDDIPQAGWMSYELTTFRQPLEAMAERILAILGATTSRAAPSACRFRPSGDAASGPDRERARGSRGRG